MSFFFFADFQGEAADAVRRGRGEFMSQFPNLATPASRRHLADPCSRSTFERCKIDFVERERHRSIYVLHTDLLKLRSEDSVFHCQSAERIMTAALGADCLALRHFGKAGDDRLIVANFGADLHLAK